MKKISLFLQIFLKMHWNAIAYAADLYKMLPCNFFTYLMLYGVRL
jgi:hypothetical protein